MELSIAYIFIRACDLWVEHMNISEVCRRGYFGYKSELKIYFEVISFDQLLNSAKERNAAFFDKIGISHI